MGGGHSQRSAGLEVTSAFHAAWPSDDKVRSGDSFYTEEDHPTDRRRHTPRKRRESRSPSPRTRSGGSYYSDDFDSDGDSRSRSRRDGSYDDSRDESVSRTDASYSTRDTRTDQRKPTPPKCVGRPPANSNARMERLGGAKGASAVAKARVQGRRSAGMQRMHACVCGWAGGDMPHPCKP